MSNSASRLFETAEQRAAREEHERAAERVFKSIPQKSGIDRISELERDLAAAQSEREAVNDVLNTALETIRTARADLAAAQAERDDFKAAYLSVIQERKKAEAEAAALKADAERYRWLKDRKNGNAVRYVETYIEPDDLDAAIDAAKENT